MRSRYASKEYCENYEDPNFKASKCVDVWSLGCIIFELFSG